MWKIVGLQWLAGLLLSTSLMWVSPDHALSAAWGVMAVALPSALFAARLSLGHSSPGSGPIVFLAGEFLKVAATICILAVAPKFVPHLMWWAMLLAAVVTLKSYLLAFLVK